MTSLLNNVKKRLRKAVNEADMFTTNVKDSLGAPIAWQPPQHQGLTGKFQKNYRLKQLDRFIKIHGTHGPESVAIGDAGYLYTGLHDGRILCYDLDGNFIQQVCNTGGRPLGIRWYSPKSLSDSEQTDSITQTGCLFVCDVILGLLKVEVTSESAGQVTVLSNSADGVDFAFADDLDISADGQHIYFTDASSKWGYDEDTYDHIEHGGHGRFLRYDVGTGQTHVLMRGLCFCNGVALSPDEDYVLVTETGSYRVHRYWLKGDKAGTHDLFVENLPGFPDNIRYCAQSSAYRRSDENSGDNHRGSDQKTNGCYWLAIPVKRNLMLDKLAPYPRFRFVLMQYVRFAPLPISHTAMVLAFDLNGNLLHNLQDHGKYSYHFITQALEHDGWLYCSSLHQNEIAKFKLADV